VSSLDAAEARRRFAVARVAVLGTVGSDAAPHLVPVVFAVQGDIIYSAVDDKPKRTRELRRLGNVRENPRVALLVEHYEEEWAALWWVRADGHARVLAPGDPVGGEAVLTLRERYPQQAGAGEVLAVDVKRWTGWAARPEA